LLSDSTLIRIIKGALLIEDDHSWSVVFAYGAVVHWNVSSEQQAKRISYYWSMQKSANHPEEDNFTFALDCPSTALLKIILKSSRLIPF